jgi:hypothetical protein
MTSSAANILVGALKRELGLAVIVRLCATPAVLTVAIFTLLAEPLPMWVLGLVTIEATPRRAAKSDSGRVAAFTRRRPVTALEVEIRSRVVEGLPVELNDVGAPPFVIGVAELAFLVQSIGVAAVKAFP